MIRDREISEITEGKMYPLEGRGSCRFSLDVFCYFCVIPAVAAHLCFAAYSAAKRRYYRKRWQAMEWVMELKLSTGAEYARALIKSGDYRRGVSGTAPMRQLHAAFRDLRGIYELIRTADTHELPQELEWLADNRYILQRERNVVAQALSGMPGGRGSGEPFVLALAKALLEHGFAHDEPITLENVVQFLGDAQREAAMTEAELHAVPVMLRLAAILFLAEPREELMKSARTIGETRRSGNRALSRRLGYAFSMLRFLASMQLESALQEISVLERLYLRDPAGAYGDMDEETKAAYRAETARLAKKAGLSEKQTAERILELAEMGEQARERHVGYYIFEKPLGKTRKCAARFIYVLALTVLPLAVALLCGYLRQSAVVGILSYLPLFETIRQMTDRVMLCFVKQRAMPRMSAEKRPDARTLCVITALLTRAGDAQEYAKKLEAYRLAAGNVGNQMVFGLLTDLKESERDSEPADRIIYDAACREIAALNEKWGGGFVLLWRDRTFVQADKRYMGRERKRGAIEDLVRLIKERPGTLRVAEGDTQMTFAYIITLDSDTEPAIGALRELVAAMDHPLNRPVLDTTRRVVREGHALIHPRIAMGLETSSRSTFAAVYAGPGGGDPYGGTVPDLYYDLYGESNYTGKGIFDVEAYAAILDDRFPENAVLSHDMIEGGYLRAGFAGDIEFLDGFPGSVRSYFEREHRWVRGDWQLLPWLFPRVKTGNGRERNPLGALTKWRILDNMRRSLTPAAVLLALFAVAWNGGGFTLAVAALACVAVPVLLCGLRTDGGRERYMSGVMPSLRAAVYRSLFDFAVLPYHAWIGISAAVTAVWRMTVTHRGMLEWTTAAQAEGKSETLRAYYSRMWPCCIAAALLLAAPYQGILRAIFCILTAAAWVAAPYAAYQVSQKRETALPALSEADRAWLSAQAARMYGYFCDHMNAENCWLPPDNYQVQPAVGLARRTSPTNIGLALLSILGAVDLGIEPRETALDRLELTAATLERMEKWNGNLYNWYQTADALPMYPRRVSSVDSGNLIACLIALEEGLRDMHLPRADKLAARIHKLSHEMRLAPLYDRERHLFRLGWDVEHDRPGEGYYDLLASEARLTSYIAVARGEVEMRHWGRLGRSLMGSDGYRGLASWSGTMFEYLMPPLLLESYPNSLLYESEQFALYCQKQRAPLGMPYGISESGFFAFDTDMNYQYKAHGVQTLGLKRGLDREMVLAPYAAYLALLVDPRDAVENLRRYETLDMSGKYGYFEALDMTHPRVPDGCAYMPVRSYMAHHVGMSLLAIVNVLCERCMVRRFMSNAYMGAFRSLLQERIPVGAVLSHEGEVENVPPERTLPRGETVLYEKKGYDPWRPECVMLSNGSYRTFVTDTGLNRTLTGMRDLTRYEERQVGGAGGIFFFITDGERLVSLTPAPFFDSDVQYSAKFEAARAANGMVYRTLSTSISTMVCPDDMAGIRRVRLKNTGTEPVETTLICYLEPALDTMQAFSAHPAFSKLFLRVEPQPDGALLSRFANDGSESYAYVACDGALASVCNARERALGREGYRGLLHPASGDGTGAPDPCVALWIPVSLKPGTEQVITVSLAYGRGAEEARAAARRALNLNRTSAAHRITELLSVLDMTPNGALEAFRMYRDVCFVTPERRHAADYIVRNGKSREILWKFGVSGDLPVIAVRAGEEMGEREERLLERHMFLYLNGAYADLLLFLNDGGDYMRQNRTAALDILNEWGGESLVGTRGGVHFIDESALEEGEYDALIAFSGVYYDLRQAPQERKPAEPYALKILPQSEEVISYSAEPEVMYTDGGVEIRGLPAVAWSHPLTNRCFGYLATDAGTGYLWYYNARENRLNAWVNDPLAVTGPETLEVLVNGKAYSLFARDTSSSVRYQPGAAVWKRELPGLKTRLTAYVHPYINARVMMVELSGEHAMNARLRWYTSLRLGERPDGQVTTAFSAEKRVIYARNRANQLYAPYTFAFTSHPAPERYTCDEADYRSGVLRYKTGAGLLPCIAAEIPVERDGDKYCAVIVCGCAVSETALNLLTDLADRAKAADGLAATLSYWNGLVGDVRIKTPDMRLNHYLNGFNAYQVIAGRLFARTSMYQSSGAYGFRDQLQDVLSLLSLPPQEERYRLVRVQLIRAAAHQYREGDVQHWWHPDRRHDRMVSERGVRTRMTDDLLFLPYTAMAYLRVSGDSAFLKLEVPYIREPELEEGRAERFGTPEKANDTRESMWQHCVRAIDCFVQRGVGKDGLALVGGGDWNDAMNRVGIAGRGESVWLSWFGAIVLSDMAAEAHVRGDEQHVRSWTAFADGLIDAAYRAWDGKWFLRGRYDNGAPLGSAQSDACCIDAISQAFAVLADPAPSTRTRASMQKTALESAVSLLWNETPVVRLFTPPFTRESTQSPGYIKSYPPGVRENGGQYTHGAIWLALGLFRAGMTEQASAVLLTLLPSERGARYLTEPYYLAADVYAAEGLYGRGGWSIYTGAAGWYLQTALSELLGLRFERGKLSVSPHLPEAWAGFHVEIHTDGGCLELDVRRGEKPGLTVDGRRCNTVPLPSDGAHMQVELLL